MKSDTLSNIVQHRKAFPNCFIIFGMFVLVFALLAAALYTLIEHQDISTPLRATQTATAMLTNVYGNEVQKVIEQTHIKVTALDTYQNPDKLAQTVTGTD